MPQTSQRAAGEVADDSLPSRDAVTRLRPVAPASNTGERTAESESGEQVRLPPYVPGEFERFVRSHTDTLEIRRLGSDLIASPIDGRGAELSSVVPADYAVAVGDEVLVTLWGSVDADLRLVVDRSGRITIPRVGAVQVAGVRSAELQDVIARRVAQTFRSFQLSVSLGQLRGIRVFVTGFVVRPGTYSVSSLSTVVAALLRAGGPSAAGSFRSVELRRSGKAFATFDLYDLLLRGDRAADQVLQAGDVIHVGPVGTQVAMVGSVNKPTIAELKPGETLSDLLQMAGGFTAVADRSRLAIERLEDRFGARIIQVALPADARLALGNGDIVRAFSAVATTLPTQRQSKRVRVEGEVLRPSEYVLPEQSTINDALKAAGGLTSRAFVFGAEFNRESVRVTQQENFDRALRDLETSMTRATVTQRATTSDEVAAQTARTASSSRLIERLRTLRPTGRIVLQLSPQGRELPDIALEDGDRIYIPPMPTTVGVFGSVFNSANYLYNPTRSLSQYLQLAGGPTKDADETSIFVLRANGDVVSNRQNSGWFRSGSLGNALALPGDSIFVPEEMDKTTFVQAAKDWTQILYQFGIGLAGIKSAVK